MKGLRLEARSAAKYNEKRRIFSRYFVSHIELKFDMYNEYVY